MEFFSDKIKLDNLEVATKLFKESRSGFLTLFNNSPICMSMTSITPMKRTYAKVNKKFIEKFGFTEAEIIGRTSVEIGILDKEESLRVGSIIQEKGRLQNDYIKCIAKDGTIVHTVSSIEPMEMNGLQYLVSFFLDISKIMEQQAIIEQHMQQLAAVNKELETFSYSVSHDLRAPVRAIEGFSRILEEDFQDTLGEEGIRLLMSVQQNARKMNDLIDGLLGLARLGKKPIEKTVIDMNLLIHEVLNELKSTVNPKTEIRLSELNPVNGDKILIKQILVNLISNAFKYSAKTDKPIVEIHSEKANDQIVYSVKDNGAGFDMKYSDKLFGVFQRLHSAQEFEGTGVGLAIVQRIVNKHGGNIQAEGEVGKGATFRFTLPE